MTDKASGSIDLIGPVNEARAPEDDIASQVVPPENCDALPGRKPHTRHDPVEQSGAVDVGSLLLALSRLQRPDEGADIAPARGTDESVPSLPQYHHTDIVPSLPASGTAHPVPGDPAAEPDEPADFIDRLDLSDHAASMDPVGSIDPVDASRPSVGGMASPNEPDLNLAGEPSRQIPPVRPPACDEVIGPSGKRRFRRRLAATGLVTATVVAVASWHLTNEPGICYPAGQAHASAAVGPTADAVARRIVRAESGGDASARNKRSTATGAGQFLAGTWLDMIRAYRPDLSRRSEAEILDLRYDPEISREMVGRFAEQNADMLRRRCLPVTAGTLYLSHFAGGAGAVAVLSAPGHADAATTMAKADSRGRTTRDMIVTANPFLRDFTVTDLRKWAERKMRGTGSI